MHLIERKLRNFIFTNSSENIYVNIYVINNEKNKNINNILLIPHSINPGGSARFVPLSYLISYMD